MAQSVPEPSNRAGLPSAIKRYLAWVLPRDGNAARQVLITQIGEMFSKPGARAMPFTASERFSVDRVAFLWEARFRVAPLIFIKVVDRFSRAHGQLRVRALGVPVQTQSGPEVDIGEAYRYLAELPWVPHAMAANPELGWREIGNQQIEVAATIGHERPTVRFEFNDAGEIVRCIADTRPGTISGHPVRAAWGGELSDYQVLGGIRMPARGEVYWDLPEGRFVYWRGEVTSAQALAEDYGADDPGAE